MTDYPRLIEQAFPLKQRLLDSVYDDKVRNRHISTLFYSDFKFSTLGGDYDIYNCE